MAYIGVKPTIGNFQICDAISVVNGQAAYTMQVGSVNVSPQSANHMIVSLNGVIQKPGSSYTVSGNTITFASNLATGDVIDFIQILGDVLDLGVPSDATVTAAKLTANSITRQTAETSIATDDTVLIHDTSAGALRKMTRANFVSGIGGDLTPAFQVTKSSAQTVSHATTTKVTWDTETFDTDSAFASDKFTVPSGEGGKYMFNFHLQVGRGTDSDMYRVYTMLYKNGSQVNIINLNLAGTDGRILNAGGSQALDLSAGDYIEIYVNTATSSGNSIDVAGGSTESSFFGGFKMLGV